MEQKTIYIWIFIKMSLKNVLHVTFSNFDEILVLICLVFFLISS